MDGKETQVSKYDHKHTNESDDEYMNKKARTKHLLMTSLQKEKKTQKFAGVKQSKSNATTK